MIGLVPAAGAGRRLRPYTGSLPKALVRVERRQRPGRYTILEHLHLGAGEVRDAVTEYVALASDPDA